MVLKDCISTPSSSLLDTVSRWLKSPLATARVPSARKLNGADRRSLNTNASDNAVSTWPYRENGQTLPIQVRGRIVANNGVALTEALVALLVLSAGLLGTLGLHQQALATHRQWVMRQLTMGVAEDLAERMKLNASQANLYAKPWGSWPSATSVDCNTSPCTRTALAAWDMQQVKQQLSTDLPEGDVAIFTTPANGWGVVVTWRDVRETYRTDATAKCNEEDLAHRTHAITSSRKLRLRGSRP